MADKTEKKELPKMLRKKSSWMNISDKVSLVAQLPHKKLTSEEEAIVEQRLRVNYYLDDGVSKWPVIHPVAATGTRQSPIDIETGKAKIDPKLKPIMVNYGKGCCKSVINTGNSFKVDVDDHMATFTGGGLGGNEFRLVQFHAHWGTTAGARGSEHTVNGKLYDAELHLVHWNTKYDLLTKAVNEPDGLAVIGIFLQIGHEDHPEFEKVLEAFEQIKYRNMKTNLEIDVDPTNFLPDDLSYWFYPGSLTTPPLDESVLWHVLRTPITISKKQCDTLASLRTGTCDSDDVSCIVNNFRPPQPLGNRTVGLFTGERHLDHAEDVNEDLRNEVHELKNLILDLRGEVKELKKQIKK